MSSERLTADAMGSPGGTFNRVLLANQGVRALVYYWYQGRGRVEANEYKVKWNLLRDAAVDGRTEEALVRIVVPLARSAEGANKQGQDEAFAAADSIAASVSRELLPSVAKVMPALQTASIR